MSEGYWRTQATTVIQQAIAEARALGYTPEETLRLVDRRYPFGERAHWPYRVWLLVRRELLGGDPTVRQAVRRRRAPPPPAAHGQLSLWE